MMPPRNFACWVGLFLLFAICQANAFSNLVIFGDSLSDTGNIAGIFGLPAPYYQNRISNGPVAIDHVANNLGLSSARSRHLFSSSGGKNFAVGGANANGNGIEDLSRQISAFQTRHPTGLGAEALYIIMIGGNDIRDASTQINAAQRAATVLSAVSAIRNSIVQLINLGARKILVANAPDISRIPETLQKSALDPGIIFRARDATTRFNTSLAQSISSIQNGSNAEIIEFDLFSTLSRVLDQPSSLGFTNTTAPCFNTDNFQILPGCHFDRYVFFDRIHPTGKAHQELGMEMIATLNGGGRSVSGIISGAIYLLLD